MLPRWFRPVTVPRRADRRAVRQGAFLLAAALLIIAPLDLPADPAPAKTPVRIAGSRYLGDLPTLIAAEQRLFARYGLAAEVQLQSTGKSGLAQLRAQQVDFALMAPTPLVLDRLRAQAPNAADEPVILAGLLYSTALNHILFRRDSGIQQPADLRGRRLALTLGTNAEFLWWVFSNFHGLEPGAVMVEDHAVEAIPTLLATGAVDAAVLWEPRIAQLRQRQGAALGEFRVGNLYTARWVLVTRRETAQARPALCAALLAAYRDAIEHIERHAASALARYAARFEVPVAALQRHWNPYGYHLSLDWSLIASLQAQLRWAAAGAGQPAAMPSVMPLIEAGPLRQTVPGAVGLPVSVSSPVAGR